MTGHDDLAERAAALTEAVETFAREVGVAGALDKRVTQQRRWIRLTAVGLALDIFLTIGGGLLWLRQSHNTDRIDRIQHVVSAEVLCPLYGLFLASYDPKGALARPDLARYENAFAIIREGADKLKCAVP